MSANCDLSYLGIANYNAMSKTKATTKLYSTNDTQIANISKEALSKVVAQKKLVALTFR